MKYFTIIACCILLLSNCFNSSPNKDSVKKNPDDVYIQQGQKIAMITFNTLSGNLQKAVKEGGIPNAVKYCNIAASPLVDSLKQVYNADIKRTSLRVRNTNNLPNKTEIKQLQNYQQQFDAGQELKPVVQRIDHQIAFYAPIHLMSLCEKCHGKVGETLKKEDYKVIQNLYPSDQAVNYKEGDLRGMWSITFNEK